MGRANDLKAFQNNADGFICSLLPGISHPQVQYSPGTDNRYTTKLIHKKPN